MNVSKKYMHTAFVRLLTGISLNSMRESRSGHRLIMDLR
jgi:hypothetical protein